MANIHPTAVVDKKAELADDVEIGAYAVIGPKVKLGPKVKIHDSAVIEGNTTIGEGTEIGSYTTIGTNGQSLKFIHESGNVTIGKNNIIREHVTVQVGTRDALDNTIIGDNNLIMINCHIAHDCIIGNNTIMSNCATLAGHVEVGDFAVLAGICAVHQFCRIGRYAMVGGMTGVFHDVIPCGMITGNRGTLSGLNVIGMRRRGIPTEEIHALRKAYDVLFAEDGVMSERLVEAEKIYGGVPIVGEVIEFIKNASKHSIVMPKKNLH